MKCEITCINPFRLAVGLWGFTSFELTTLERCYRDQSYLHRDFSMLYEISWLNMRWHFSSGFNVESASRGPFLKSSGNFSYSECHGKISNLMITELFYSRILNINRAPKSLRGFPRNGPPVTIAKLDSVNQSELNLKLNKQVNSKKRGKMFWLRACTQLCGHWLQTESVVRRKNLEMELYFYGKAYCPY